ncbi:TFPI2: Tissue factor pathway inhibitor, partial [Crotalus adamanteus]
DPQEICLQDPDVGRCSGTYPRFYYNTAIKNCEEFVYSGCGGNENNFLNWFQCRAACQNSIILPPKCLLKPVIGWCWSPSVRYVFNAVDGKCMVFLYSGCLGNENNFSTETECLRECKPTPGVYPAKCTYTPTIGWCMSPSLRYFFYPPKAACMMFTYSGCGGNANNFLTLNECIKQCQSVVNAQVFTLPCTLESEPNIYSCNDLQGQSVLIFFFSLSGDPQAICLQNVEVGRCRGSFPRFYYNTATKNCEEFYYGGCGGNKNNFLYWLQCRATCQNSSKEDILIFAFATMAF